MGLSGGAWEPLYEVVPRYDPMHVEAKLADSSPPSGSSAEGTRRTWPHQHLHREEPLRSVLAELARELDVPLRSVSSNVDYCGEFTARPQRAKLTRVDYARSSPRIFEALPEGTTELGCHPAEANDADSVYGAERQIELRTLCDPRVRTTLDELEFNFAPSTAFAIQPRRNRADSDRPSPRRVSNRLRAPLQSSTDHRGAATATPAQFRLAKSRRAAICSSRTRRRDFHAERDSPAA